MAVVLGSYLLGKKDNSEIYTKKEKEIEKTIASDLVSNSVNAESYRRRKSKICDTFRNNSNQILSDILGRTDEINCKTNTGRGRDPNKHRL